MTEEIEKINNKVYKKLYYEELINQQRDRRFEGWVFAILFSLFTILVWIFGFPELWNLKGKIFMTMINLVLFYMLGYFPIRKANQLIRKYRGEIENEKR